MQYTFFVFTVYRIALYVWIKTVLFCVLIMGIHFLLQIQNALHTFVLIKYEGRLTHFMFSSRQLVLISQNYNWLFCWQGDERWSKQASVAFETSVDSKSAIAMKNVSAFINNIRSLQYDSKSKRCKYKRKEEKKGKKLCS